MPKKPPTIAQLKKLYKDLERFHDWYFEDDNSSSESSDARTTLSSIENAIEYTPAQIEKDKIEDRAYKQSRSYNIIDHVIARAKKAVDNEQSFNHFPRVD